MDSAQRSLLACALDAIEQMAMAPVTSWWRIRPVEDQAPPAAGNGFACRVKAQEFAAALEDYAGFKFNGGRKARFEKAASPVRRAALFERTPTFSGAAPRDSKTNVQARIRDAENSSRQASDTRGNRETHGLGGFSLLTI